MFPAPSCTNIGYRKRSRSSPEHQKDHHAPTLLIQAEERTHQQQHRSLSYVFFALLQQEIYLSVHLSVCSFTADLPDPRRLYTAWYDLRLRIVVCGISAHFRHSKASSDYLVVRCAKMILGRAWSLDLGLGSDCHTAICAR